MRKSLQEYGLVASELMLTGRAQREHPLGSVAILAALQRAEQSPKSFDPNCVAKPCVCRGAMQSIFRLSQRNLRSPFVALASPSGVTPI